MPRTYASESRLIHRRLASGKKPTTRVVTGKDEFNKPIVQQRTDVAVKAQNVARAKTLSSKTANVESYIDPSTGLDSRERDKQGNFIEGTGTLFKTNVSGPLAPTLARLDSTEGPSRSVPNDALVRLRNQANGDPTNPNDELQIGTGQSPDAQGIGVIEQRRNARLDANNATPQQRQRNQLALRGIADPVGEKLASVRARIAQEEANGTHSYTVEEKAMMEQQAIAEGQAELNVQQQASDQATQQAQATGVAGDKTTQSKGQQQPQFTPEQTQQQAALQAAISGLPPEMQPFGQAIMQSLQSSQQGQADLNRGLQAQGQSFQDQRDDLESTIRGIADRADQTFKSIDKNAQSIRDRNEQNLSEQEAAAKARLDWQEQEQTRKLNDQKKKAIDSKIAQLAMTGRANSSGGLKELEEVGREYEKAISDLQIEMGVQRTELGARFTALHTEVWNDYELGYENNRKDLTATLERISLQGLSSRQAIAKAEDTALQAFIQNTIGLRKETSKALQDGITQVYGLIADDKKMKSDLQSALWKRLFDQRAQDGNLNPGLTQSILADMQRAGIDVSGIDPYAQTVDQQNIEYDNSLNELKLMNEMQREAIEARQKANGKPLLQAQLNQVKDYEDSLRSLETLESQILSEFADVGGPISGRLGSFPGSELLPIAGNTALTQKKLRASLDRVKQLVGKAMEGGVLRKEDEAKYERILPTIKDTDEIRKFKLQELKKEMDWGRRNLLKNLQLNGYDTNGFDAGDPLDDDGPGLLPNSDADEILNKLENGEPLVMGNAGKALAMLGSKETQGFATPLDPKLYSPQTIRAWSGTHRGVDIAMTEGTRLPSVVPGTVKEAGYQPGWGNTVVIVAEDGTEHRYSHLRQIDVEKGSVVTPGQIIALSGGAKGRRYSGTSTGPHLDYRVKKDGRYIDPYSYKLSKTF